MVPSNTSPERRICDERLKCPVPRIFPDGPKYLTAVKPQRLNLEFKEESTIRDAYQKSLADFKEAEAKFIIYILHCIHSNWLLVHQPYYNIVLFLKIRY